MRSSLLSLAVASALVPVAAHADTKAWTAAKANLPADATIVIGMNFAPIAKSQLFTELFPKLVASSADFKDFLDTAKSACNVDPVSAINSAVIASDSTKSQGVVYLALNGLDQAKLASCADKVAKAKGHADEKLTFKKDGNIVELTSSKQNKTVYYGWVGSDVIVITKDADKAGLQRWMQGKGFANGALAKAAAKVDTNAAGWGVTTEGKQLQPNLNMKGGFGTFDLKGGVVSVKGHMTTGSPTEATNAATEGNKQLTQMKSSGQLPAMFNSLMKDLKITSEGADLVMSASAPEKDVLGMVQMAMAMGAFGNSHNSAPPPPPPPAPHTQSPGLQGAGHP